MLTSSIFHDLERGVIATFPMYGETQLARNDIHNDLFKYGTQDSLLCRSRCSRMIPQPRQVGTQAHELCTLDIGNRRGLATARSIKVAFKACDVREPVIPSSFKIGNDQSILWIYRIILPMSASCFKACLFKLQFDVLQTVLPYALTILVTSAAELSENERFEIAQPPKPGKRVFPQRLPSG